MRHRRVRGKIHGTAECPRLCVFRSNKRISLQLIDDDAGKTLLGLTETPRKKSTRRPASPKLQRGELADKKKKSFSGVESAQELGQLFAKEALKKKIKRAVFDRGGYKYHGRVKAVAEGAREGGLKL